MNARALVTVVLVITSGAVLWVVITQAREISDLHAEQNRIASASQGSAPVTEILTTPATTPEVPRELLQLRAEVARLSQQKRDLAGARGENEKLRLQLENRRTNSVGKSGGAGYMRKSEAKWAGCNTPENTLQSFFWAVHNHNTEKFLETLLPENAALFKARVLNSDNAAEEFFRSFPPGYVIVGRQQDPDGSLRLVVQIVPDNPPEFFLFKEVAGLWKLRPPL